MQIITPILVILAVFLVANSNFFSSSSDVVKHFVANWRENGIEIGIYPRSNSLKGNFKFKIQIFAAGVLIQEKEILLTFSGSDYYSVLVDLFNMQDLQGVFTAKLLFYPTSNKVVDYGTVEVF